MWTSFFLAVAAGVIFLYLPGFALGWACGLSGIASLCCAPLFSVSVGQVVCIACGVAGVACSWELVFLSSAALGLAAAAVRMAVGCFGLGRRERVAARASGARGAKGKGGCERVDSLAHGRARFASPVRGDRFDWLCLAAYVAFGLALGLYVYVAPLGDPTQFSEGVDNTHHLNSIRSFLDSGVWSSLSVTLYPEGSGASIDPTPGTSFYPSGWHMLAAMMVQAVGCEVVVAEHAANFAFIAFVFATSMFLLMRVVFAGRRAVVAVGALLAFSFAMFPWSFTYFGPLYPNLASYACMPAASACFICAVASGISRGERVTWGVAFVIGMVALVLLQTNAVFSVAAFLIAFCVWRVWEASGEVARWRRVLRCVGFAAFAVAVWTALFYAPPLRSVVTHEWVAFESYPHGLFDVATMGFRGTAQLGLAFLAFVGAVSTLLRGKGRAYAWVTASCTLFCIMYVMDVASNGFIKFFLTGFWYTDSYRVAASAVLAVVPLASWGAYCVFEAVRTWASRLGGEKAHGRSAVRGAHASAALQGEAARVAPPDGRAGVGAELRVRRSTARMPSVLAGVLVALIALSVYVPGSVQVGGYQLKTAFQDARDSFGWACDPSTNRVYSPSEREFVSRVKETVGEDAGIINQPNDGSGFAYGSDDLNVMYRFMRGVGGSGETAQSVAIRTRLNEVATDGEVRAAVRDLGVDYVLQLDHTGGEAKEYFLFCYVPEEWTGINAVDDDTPGFEVVLSEGDMRLYRIVA